MGGSVIARTALLAVIVTAAPMLSPRASAAGLSDDISPSEAEQRDEPVCLHVSDLEAAEIRAAALQPLPPNPPAVVPGIRVQPRPRRPPLLPPVLPRAQAAAPESLLAAYPTRPRRSLATVPHMFGDFFGGGGGQALISVPPISVLVTDGPFDLFVTNLGLSDGANVNPAVPIVVRNGPGGPLVTTSIGNGLDLSGDGQPDTYPTSVPNVPNVLPPPVPWPGTLVYTGGNAVYAQGTPADGSVGQGDGWGLLANYVLNPSLFLVDLPTGGGAVRRAKVAEHNSPEPRDRLLFSYNFYNDVIGGLGDVSQYTIGFEHTIGSSDWSFELRLPFAGTLDNQQVLGAAEMRDLVFGNLTLLFKTVLYEVPTGLISAGLGVAAPTSPSVRLLAGQTPILEIENRSAHLLPFLAAMSMPDPRWYWQGFLQLDLDTCGNRLRGDVWGENLSQFGILQDAPLLFADAGVGYMLFENPDAPGITRIAPTAELHYSTTLQDADVAVGNGFVIQSFTPRYDVLNLTLGTSIVFNERLSIRPAMVVPLRDGHDQHFDYEAIVQVDWQL